jgi:Spy/CpxP family protein refolding chaperone
MSMHMRRILLTIINAMMILPLAAQAQQSGAPADSPAATQAQGDRPAQRQQQRMALLAQTLNLTDDQKRRWLQIQKETTQNVRAARKDDSLNEEQMQQKLKDVHAEQRRKLLALLTPEQQEGLKKWWEEQRQKQQQEKGAGAAPDSAAGAAAKDDDFFAGMVQDPDPPAHPAPSPNQTKAAPPQN